MSLLRKLRTLVGALVHRALHVQADKSSRDGPPPSPPAAAVLWTRQEAPSRGPPTGRCRHRPRRRP